MSVLGAEANQLEVAQRLRRRLREAVKSRYPVVLVIAEPGDAASEFWQAFAKAEGLAYVDLLEEIEKESLRRASYTWPELADWIRRRVSEAGGAVVVDLDVIATRWDERDRERLFQKLVKSDLRDEERNATPLVLVSSLAGSCELPGGYQGRDWGFVEDLRE